MTFNPLTLLPGVVADTTSYLAEGHYVDSQLIRFKDGVPQTIGGWQKLTTTPTIGTPRNVFSWILNDRRPVVAIGTSRKFYVYIGGAMADITPIRRTTALTNPITTINGSNLVTITDTTHGAIVGTFVTFTGMGAAYHGITLSGEYEVKDVLTANTYVVQAAMHATSGGGSGGGAITAAYQINPGKEGSVLSYGWGAGAYGKGTWGTPRTGSTLTMNLRTWSIAAWGEDLLFSPSDGNIYLWDASTGSGTRGTLVSSAPTNNKGFVLSGGDGHLIVYGANSNPRLIKWCNQGDYNDWVISETTTAGEIDIAEGDEFITGRCTQHEILLWMKSNSLYSMRFLGEVNNTFSLTRIGSNVSLVGPNAVAELGGNLYWMGLGHPYMYNGMVNEIPCPCNKFVYDDFNVLQGYKVVCGTIEKFNEVMFFYPTTTGENDRYFKINLRDQLWDIGAMARTAWKDIDIYPFPIAMTPDGYLYQHEQGDTADGAPLVSEVTTSYLDIAEGERFAFISRILADFKMNDRVELTFYVRDYPHGLVRTKGPFVIAKNTTQIWPRVRGRQVAVHIRGPNGYWQLGKLQVDRQEDGRR